MVNMLGSLAESEQYSTLQFLQVFLHPEQENMWQVIGNS